MDADEVDGGGGAPGGEPGLLQAGERRCEGEVRDVDCEVGGGGGGVDVGVGLVGLAAAAVGRSAE